jgi:tetratricopeptide (TPR) repeat protein
MKTKDPAEAGRAQVKTRKQQASTTTTGRLLKMTSKPQITHAATESAYAQAVQDYQDGLRALQERKFEKAKTLFQKVGNDGPREFIDRARVHLTTCLQHLERARTTFASVDEHYDYAISLINIGDFVSAREHMDKVLKDAPKADFAWYGMATLECLTGHYEEALRALNQSIQLNPANRFQARNDADFNNLADDPRFTELLYPENGPDPVPASRFAR